MAMILNGQVGWKSGVAAAPTIVTNGLILNLDAGNSASYPGTGTTWTDLSGNNRNGNLANGVGYSSSNGGYLTFDGVNDYVSISNMSSALVNKTKFSYETWSKCNNPSSTNLQTIFSFGESNQFSNDIMFFYYTGEIRIQVNNGADGEAITPFTSTTWNHIVVVYDGTQTGNSNRLKLYVNGVLQVLNFGYTVPSSTSNINMTECRIGEYSTSTSDGAYLNGSIGLSRLYNTSLSASEVLQNFNATKTRFGL